jgi:hypothetical protein
MDRFFGMGQEDNLSKAECRAHASAGNLKFEARNSNQVRMLKARNRNIQVTSTSGLCFEFRASDFGFQFSRIARKLRYPLLYQ